MLNLTSKSHQRLPVPSDFRDAPDEAKQACENISLSLQNKSSVAQALKRISTTHQVVVAPINRLDPSSSHLLVELIHNGWLASWVTTPEGEAGILIGLPGEESSLAKDAT